MLYIVLAAIPFCLWLADGNPVAATIPYLSRDMAALVWNTLLVDPTGDASVFGLAGVDLLWIAWTPFALAAALQLLITTLRLPRTLIPRILLNLTPTAVVSLVVSGTAAAAQTPAGAVHANVLQHHHHEHEGGRGQDAAYSALEAQLRSAITDSTHTVAPGETLWSIAQHAYGSGEEWPEIYNANRGHIQPDSQALTSPDLLEPGWTLTVPEIGATTAPTTTGNATPTPPPVPPNVSATAPNVPTADAATSAPTGRVAPATPAPATTTHPRARAATDRPAPRATATAGNHPHRPHPAPGRRADAPFTTGLDLPEGGYIGITLLMAAAGATIAMRRRRANRSRSAQSPDVPDSTSQLTVIAARAEMADAGEWDPELETDPTPPPLLRPRAEHLIFGTSPTGADEAILDPERHPLTVYTGPGAHQAAAALALSALSSQPPHRLIIAEALAQQLLGAGVKLDDADWLTLTPDTPAALHAAASATTHPAELAGNANTLVIADAPSAGIFHISAALAADKQHNRLAILLLGDSTHLAAHNPTTIDIDAEGWPNKTTGPRAAAFAAARFHTLPQPTAADLYHVLRHDRTRQAATRIPAQTRDEHQAHPLDQPAEPAPDSADDEDPAATVAPLLLRVLGPLTFENAAGQTKPGPGGRNAQLLTYLALHPRGRTLQQITAAIWNTDKPAGANRTLVRVRQELQAVITELCPDLVPPAGEDFQPVIREPHGTYHLNHQLIRTDYTDLARLDAEIRREKDPTRRAELAAQALAHMRGELAEGVSDIDQDWLAVERAELEDRASSLACMTRAVARPSG